MGRDVGEALCGFANAGGVIVWGVKADKNPVTKVDAASGIALVPTPTAVKTRLTELQKEQTNPPLGDVEIDVYLSPDRPDLGTAIAAGWIPSYWEGDAERSAPVCPACQERHGIAYDDDDGGYALAAADNPLIVTEGR